MLSPVLPAAVTNRMLFAPSVSISSESACEKAVPLNVAESLTTRMFTPACLAATSHCRAAISPLVSPAAWELSHLTGRSVVCQFIPATPVALLPTAPMIPATWVPWPP